MQSGGIDFDFSGVNTLIADLAQIPMETPKKVAAALERTAFSVNRDWTAEAKASNRKHAKRYPYSVDYDLSVTPGGQIQAEIGPNLGERGGTSVLGTIRNLLANPRGRRNNGGGQAAMGILEESKGGVDGEPQHNARRALRKNLADFERGILKATEGDI